MGITDKIFHLFGTVIIKWPARKTSISDLIASLETTGHRIMQDGASDTAENRDVLRHVIGIERWGQRRLNVALGEPPVMDEYDGYKPAADTSVSELGSDFVETRQETIALARELADANSNGDVTVQHNQWGDLTVRHWLYYLKFHADKDVKGLD